MKIIYLILCVGLLSSCFKTTEQIAREKRVDAMSVQLDQSSKLVADLTSQVQMLQTQLATYTGQVEEQTHSQKQELDKRLKTWQEVSIQMDALNKVTGDQSKQIKQLEQSLKEQGDYLKKVLKALGKKTGKKTSKSKNSLYSKANQYFEKNKLKLAKKTYLEVLSENKINASQKNAVYYNLGLINYWNKSYEDSISFFSKIYTKYPKSSYAPKALYYIAFSLKKSGEKDAAVEAFKELIKNYPKSKQAKKAKDEVK